MAHEFRLEYTQEFWEDISETITYIARKLENPAAAQNLKDDAEAEILKRASAPLAFAPYYTDSATGDVYYPIYIKNFIVFYVVIGEVMEVRRFVYGKRNMVDVLAVE